MVSLARGTLPWVLVPLAAGLVLLAASGPLNVPYGVPAGAALVVLAALLAAFFRDPHRDVAQGVVAPADGRVRYVDADEDALRIVTFMNLHHVHVNRAPLGGAVADRTRRPGGHLPAFLGGAKGNERVTYTLETAVGPVEVAQVAGTVARRIDPWVEPGDDLAKGDRLGIIRFGSRVDVHLPPDLEPAVAPGDRVRAAETTIAEAPIDEVPP